MLDACALVLRSPASRSDAARAAPPAAPPSSSAGERGSSGSGGGARALAEWAGGRRSAALLGPGGPLAQALVAALPRVLGLDGAAPPEQQRSAAQRFGALRPPVAVGARDVLALCKVRGLARRFLGHKRRSRSRRCRLGVGGRARPAALLPCASRACSQVVVQRGWRAPRHVVEALLLACAPDNERVGAWSQAAPARTLPLQQAPLVVLAKLLSVLAQAG